MSSFNAENILNQLPGMVLLKTIDNNKAKYQWCNQACSEMLGYANNDLLVDIFEEDIACDSVANNANTFLAHDRAVLQGESIQTIDIYNYAQSDIVGLVGKKTPFIDANGNVAGILFNGTLVFKDNLLSNFIVTLAQTNKQYSQHKTPEGTFRIATQAECLSARESECLFYILRGKTSREISTILNRSPKTVESHIERIRQKLGVKDKSQLIEFAYNNNLYWSRLNLTTHLKK